MSIQHEMTFARYIYLPKKATREGWMMLRCTDDERRGEAAVVHPQVLRPVFSLRVQTKNNSSSSCYCFLDLKLKHRCLT